MSKSSVREISLKLTFLLLTVTCAFLCFFYFPADYEKPLQFRLNTFVFSVFAVLNIILLKPEIIKKQHVIISLALGALSLPVTIPLSFLGIIFAVAVTFCCLNYCTLFTYDDFPRFIRLQKIEVLKDLIIILILVLVCVLLRIKSLSSSEYTISLTLSTVLPGISAGIGEEMLFRVLPLAFLFQISKRKKPNIIYVIILLSVPFVLLHLTGEIAASFYTQAFNSSISLFIYSMFFTIILIRRDYFCAAATHIFIDIIINSIK